MSIYDAKSKQNKCYAYEIIREGHLIKPYLDVEQVFDSIDEMNINKTLFLNKVQKDIVNLFTKEYGKTIDNDDIYITDGSRVVVKDGNEQNKMSFHIIIAPKNINLLYRTNTKFGNSSAYHFYTTLLKMDEDFYTKLLDGTVYTKDRAFRCIGSYKNKDEAQCFQKVDNVTFESINKIAVDTFLKFAITHEDLNLETEILETPLFEQTVKDKRFILTNQLTTTDYITTELIYRINKGVTNGMFCIKDDKYEVSDFTGCDDVVYTGFSKGFFGLKH